MKSQIQPYSQGFAGHKLTELVKVRFKSQLVKMNKTLINYVDQLTQDDLLLLRLPDKV